MRRSILPLLACLALLATASCARSPAADPNAAAPAATRQAKPPMSVQRDEHSYAEPDKIRIADLALDLALDFEHTNLSGTATYALKWLDPHATQLALDTRDLTIAKVEGIDAQGRWSPLHYSLATRDAILGSKLVIDTPARNA